MKDYHTALIYGTLSAITLPLGAICGILTTLSQATIAMGIAFGAGALLFAVTVELYGSAIERLERKNFGEDPVFEILSTAVGAVVGAVLYIMLCRWLDQTLEDLDLGTLEDLDASPDIKPANEDVQVPEVNVFHHERPATPVDVSPVPSRIGRRQRSRQNTWNGAASPWSISRQASDDEEEEEMATARGRKRAVLGVLSAGYFDRALKRDRIRNRSGSPLVNGYDDVTYGSMTTRSEREKYLQDLYDQQHKEHRVCSVERLNDLRVAGGIWLGVLLDGIPEAIMLGYLAAEYKLTFALVAALLIANFPESFSSAALLYRRGVEAWKIILMWLFLCLFTGIIACVTAYNLPGDLIRRRTGEYKDRYEYLQFLGALIEGMAGGAMLACISNIMLPEAFKHKGDVAGIFVLMGFLVATMIKVFGGVIQERIT